MPHELWTNLPITGMPQSLAIIYARFRNFFLIQMGKWLEGGKICSWQRESCQCGSCVKLGERHPVFWVDAVSPGPRARGAECRLISALSPSAGGMWGSPSPCHTALWEGHCRALERVSPTSALGMPALDLHTRDLRTVNKSVTEWWGWESSQAGQRLHYPCLFRGFHRPCLLSKNDIGSQPMQTANFSEIIYSR